MHDLVQEATGVDFYALRHDLAATRTYALEALRMAGEKEKEEKEEEEEKEEKEEKEEEEEEGSGETNANATTSNR